MKFRRPLCGLLLLLVFPSGGSAVDLFLSPRLTLEAGYENNRYLLPTALTNTASSAFLRAAPAVSLHLLAGAGTEVSAGVSGAHTEYLRSDLKPREELMAYLEWWQTGAPFEGGLRLAGGLSRDSAIPEDDFNWFAATPALRYILPQPDWQLTAQVRLAFDQFDTRLTTNGVQQTDQTLEFRPGLRWLPTRDAILWAELYLEKNDSNEDAFDYQGFGLALGGSLWVTPRGQFAAAVQAGARTFADVTDETGLVLQRRDQPLRAEVSYTYRLLPWLDLFCSAAWYASGSDQSVQDVSGWSAQVGLTLAQDYPLFSGRH